MTTWPFRHGRQPTARAAAAAALLALLGLGSARGAVFRIDETGTVVNRGSVQMQWRHPAPHRNNDNTLESTLRVDVRLNLQPWLNRPAKIFLVLAPLPSERVRARWSTQGRLMQGSMYSGERAVVYDGLAGPAVFTDSLLLTLEADGDTMRETKHLKFHFEIEVAP